MNNLCHLQIESQKPYIAHKTCHKKGAKISSVSAFFMKKLCANALGINYEKTEKNFYLLK